MKKTVIYLLRHGEVENPGKILYGRKPGFGLSKNGIARIREVAREFKSKQIDFMYASPLLRARQTAGIISNRIGIKPQISGFLIESKIYCEGISLTIFKRDIQPKLYEEKFVKQGQESVADQERRMQKFVQKVIKLHPGKTILAVSHGDPIVILKANIIGIPFSWEFKRDNYLLPGFYITLEFDKGKFKIK